MGGERDKCPGETNPWETQCHHTQEPAQQSRATGIMCPIHHPIAMRNPNCFGQVGCLAQTLDTRECARATNGVVLRNVKLSPGACRQACVDAPDCVAVAIETWPKVWCELLSGCVVVVAATGKSVQGIRSYGSNHMGPIANVAAVRHRVTGGHSICRPAGRGRAALHHWRLHCALVGPRRSLFF